MSRRHHAFFSPPCVPVSLPVRACHTLSGRAPRTVTYSVRCPRQETSVSLDECLECDCCIGVAPTELGDVVRCIDDVAREETALEGRRSTGMLADYVSVSAIMTRDVVCVRTDVSIEALTALLVESELGGVPVVGADGEPIGMVSKTDLVRMAHDGEPATTVPDAHAQRHEVGEPGLREVDVDLRTVADIMTPLAFSLSELGSVAQAAAMMACEGVHRLPVVDDGGKIVGILSTIDIARWIAASAGYLVDRDPHR